MKQLVSSPSGVRVIDVPAPTPRRGEVVVRVEYSCVSPGSELAALASHQESLLHKLRARPEKALAVWRLLRSKGGPPPISYDSLIRTTCLVIIAQRVADWGRGEVWSAEGA